MSRVSWLNGLNPAIHSRRPRRNRRATNVSTVLSRIEALEDRTLLATFTVTDTGDSGPGTLRQAMLDANAAAGTDTIAFNLPADDAGHVYYQDDGIAGQVTLSNVAVTTEADDANIADIDPDWAFSWWTIAPLSQLPALTDAVLIDGYTQTGSHQNINAVGQGLDTILRVEIDGTQSAVENEIITTGLLTLNGGNSTVRGLAINRQLGPGVLIGSTGNMVEGNFIGPDISGTAEFDTSGQPTVDVRFSNGFNGVTVSSGFSTNNVIGGTTAAARNLISANTGGPPSSSDNFGVKFLSDNNRVAGNLIGTDRAGTAALPNGSGGVSAGSRNTIGGQDAAAGNVISGNPVGVVAGNTNFILNNFIGTDPSGTLNVGNTAVGILVSNASDNLILSNTVAFNGAAPPSGGISGTASAAGIRVVFGTVGTGNLISRNSIFGNFGPGIDLGTDGFTLNDVPPASDPPDQDTGANDLQNTPILTSVTDTGGGGTDVVGMLQSTPNSNFRIEFFTNRDRNFDADGTGQLTGGEAFFASVDVVTGATGVANFAFPLPPLPVGMPYVTATATNITDDGSGPLNNTSEFSAAQPEPPVRADLLALRTSDVRFEAQASDGTQFTRDTDYGLLAGTAALSDHRVGDFNGDGLDDVVARRDATGQVIVALSDGTQMTSAVWTLWSPNATWDQVVVGDFDRDGRDDLAGLSSSGTFLVSLSNGTSFDNVSFGAVSGTVDWVDLFSGDVNNDGFDDVILRSSTGAWVVGLSDGIRFSFSVFARWSSVVNWRDVTTGDFNGDGRLDVVGRSPSGKVVVGLSDGTGFSFSVFATWSTAVSWETQIGDFNNDGRDDIFSRASSGTIVMNLSTGTGFTPSVWGALSTNVDWLFFVGDFDADGDDDIAGIASTGTMVTGLSTGSGFNTSVWGAWPDRDTRNPYFVGNFVTG